MSKIKNRFGRQIATDTIVLRRRRGWHARRLVNGQTSFREVINRIVQLGGIQHGQFTEQQIIATLSDIVGARNGVATFRVYPNPYTTRYEQVAHAWQTHCGAGYNQQRAYVEGVLFAAFLQASKIIACEGDFHAMLAEYVTDYVPDLNQILGYTALDNVLEQFRRLWDDATRDLAQVRDNTSNLHMTSVAYYITRFWDDVVDTYEQELQTLNRFASHMTALVWHALHDQGDYVPKTIDPASVGQMLRLSNLVIPAIHNGVGSTITDFQETWALHLFQKIYTTASREDSYMEIVDTASIFKDAVNILDYMGHKGGEDMLRIIRPSKIKNYEISVGRQRNAHTQPGSFYFIQDSEATGRITTLINDVMRLMAVDKVWKEEMDHHYGTAIQFVSVLPANDASLQHLRNAMALVIAQEVEVRPGAIPLYHVMSNPETYKRLYGVDLVRGGVQRIIGADRVVACGMNQILEDRDLVKHQLPFYDLKTDEVTSVNNQNLVLSVLPQFNAALLDYEGQVHAKRISIQRALGLMGANELTMVQNQYLAEEINFIMPHWQQIINSANDYGPFLGMWLREALAMSKQYFGAVTPTLIQQTSAFIPREEVETREIRLIQATNALALMAGTLAALNPQMGTLFTATTQCALTQHHLYTMVD